MNSNVIQVSKIVSRPLTEEVVLDWLTDWEANLSVSQVNNPDFWRRNKIAQFIKNFGLKHNRWKYQRRGNPKKGYHAVEEKLKAKEIIVKSNKFSDF